MLNYSFKNISIIILILILFALLLQLFPENNIWKLLYSPNLQLQTCHTADILASA